MLFKLYFSKKVSATSHQYLLLISLIVNIKNLSNLFFALFIFSKSFITNNLTVFKNLNILKMELKKIYAQWLDQLTL